MSDIHARLRDKLFEDLTLMSQMDIIEAIDHSLAEGLLEQYEEGLQMDKRAEVFGVTYIVAELLLSYFEHEGVAVTHHETVPAGRDLSDMVNTEALSDDEAALVESYTERRSEEPRTYAELFDLYVPLADGLLTDLDYRTSERTDHESAADEEVRALLERGGQSFGTTLHTTGRELDIESVLSVLNRVLEDTTTDDRRFSRVEFRSDWSHVFCCSPYQLETLKNYFSFATGEIRDDLESDRDN